MPDCFDVARAGVGVLLCSSALVAVNAKQVSPTIVRWQSRAAASQAAAPHLPNIVLITTDDQRLADQRFMPRTNRLVGDRGVTLTGVSNHPQCCPARAEMLTGQFAQNNGVRTNGGRLGGYHRLDKSQTVATWLSAAGYSTAFMGKYLNGYGRAAAERPEPGWDVWEPTVANHYEYRDFTAVRRGVLHRVRNSYQTDYFTRRGVSTIDHLAAKPEPFFLWQSYMAPHGRREHEGLASWQPPVSAKRHQNMFKRTRLDSLRKPSFNEAEMSDKPVEMRRLPLLTAKGIAKLTEANRLRLRALQAVDEGVASMVRELRQSGELGNTIIIFASDNGLSMGEHRYVGKIVGYEESLRVPLLIRGPGVPANKNLKAVGATVDIAPTIVAAAGATATHALDGRDLRPVIDGTPSWSTLLIQGGPSASAPDDAGWLYRGVRTARYTYIRYEFPVKQELYDRLHDPYEVASVIGDQRYSGIRRELASRLSLLSECAGSSCRQNFGRVPRPSPR